MSIQCKSHIEYTQSETAHAVIDNTAKSVHAVIDHTAKSAREFVLSRLESFPCDTELGPGLFTHRVIGEIRQKMELVHRAGLFFLLDGPSGPARVKKRVGLSRHTHKGAR